MSICAIINPRAGSVAHRVDAVCDGMRESGCEVLTTQARGDARAIARAAVEQGAERIIAVGGDGTISEVINGIGPDFERVTLAIVPGGTGNDLARCLDLPSLDEGLLERAVRGEGRAVDVVRVREPEAHYFLNVASCGFGGDVADSVTTDAKERWGASAYWMAAASRIVELERHAVHLRIDDHEIDLHIFGVQIANGRFVGGGFPIAPLALLDDGLLDLIIIPADSPAELIARGFERIIAWTQGDDGPFPSRGKRVRITGGASGGGGGMKIWTDGEARGAGDIDMEVLPRALRVVTGDEPVGFSEETG